jgi:hypothetical protein
LIWISDDGWLLVILLLLVLLMIRVGDSKLE